MERIICKNYDEVSLLGANILAKRIKENPKSILGLATGSTPVGMYKKLVEMHSKNGLDFSEIRTFNLDEYYPIKKSNEQSYDFFMWDNLFSHINIKRENVHLPNGESADPEKECIAYERMLAEAGGVDIQVLGIGINGHIGFNEPENELKLATHLTSLTPSTIDANSRFFRNIEDVPTKALTMGMGTIMKAKSILLLITGENKAPVVKKLFSGVATTGVPASFLHLHSNVIVLLDEAAAKLL
ncbi:MAG: glucosamine-6-phosphate deaminase [Endomicrobia bacterium]|nr:glucosamine-6-phosphate deaminase [Endomicrobiia bacterium]MCL2799771.1 glucosamine-6-phosphate deaminase [Endomicrobiia bacterium]